MKTTSNFEARYKKLNLQQKEAVDTIEGPVLVVAGPGTGKTELLSMRAANILKLTDTPPQSILCLTYTEAAAMNMRQRLRKLIGPTANKISIHTFHGFGAETLNRYNEYFYDGINYQPVNTLTKLEILENLLENTSHRDPLRSYHPSFGYAYLQDIMNRINDLKQAGLSSQKFLQTLQENEQAYNSVEPILVDLFAAISGKRNFESCILVMQTAYESLQAIPLVYAQTIAEQYQIQLNHAIDMQSFNPVRADFKKKVMKADKNKTWKLKDRLNHDKSLSLAALYEGYQVALQEQGLFDFADMLIDTVNGIEKHPDLQFTLQEQYLYIMVDEFQDTSGVQMQMIRSIADPMINNGQPNIMVVGDDDQSIYKFQGASLQNILDFHTKYHSPQIIVLKENYRSTAPILEISRSVITQADQRLEYAIDSIDKTLKSNYKGTETEIITQSFETTETELHWIMNNIKTQQISDNPPSEVALLCRTNKELHLLADYCEQYGIDAYFAYQTNILEADLIREILVLIRFCNSLLQPIMLVELLPEILSFSCWGLKPTTLYSIALTAREQKQSWMTIMQTSEDEQIKAMIETLLELGKGAQHLSAPQFIEKIIDTVFRQAYFSEEQKQSDPRIYLQHLGMIDSLMQAAKEHQKEPFLTVSEFLSIIDLHEKHGQGIYTTIQTGQSNASITLMTTHKSKGLEFDTVYAPNLSEKHWNTSRNFAKISFPINLPLTPDANTQDDHIRLLFVALTRAKRQLVLTHHKITASNKSLLPLSFLDKQWEKSEINTSTIETSMEIEDIKQTSLYIAKDMKVLLEPYLENYQLSVTALNNFLNIEKGGPQYFIEQNLLRFPRAKSAAAAYGTAMHKALYTLWTSWKCDEQKPTTTAILNTFEIALKHEYLPEEDFEFQLKKGTDYLTLYTEQAEPIHCKTAYEYNFSRQQVRVNQANITGAIDAMLFDEENKTITVVDYKTGKAKQNWISSVQHWQYQNQLKFYKLLVEYSARFGKSYTVPRGSIEFLTPEQNQFHTLSLNLDTQNMESFSTLVQAVYSCIVSQEFPDISAYTSDNPLKNTKQLCEDLILSYNM